MVLEISQFTPPLLSMDMDMTFIGLSKEEHVKRAATCYVLILICGQVGNNTNDTNIAKLLQLLKLDEAPRENLIKNLLSSSPTYAVDPIKYFAENSLTSQHCTDHHI